MNELSQDVVTQLWAAVIDDDFLQEYITPVCHDAVSWINFWRSDYRTFEKEVLTYCGGKGHPNKHAYSPVTWIVT